MISLRGASIHYLNFPTDADLDGRGLCVSNVRSFQDAYMEHVMVHSSAVVSQAGQDFCARRVSSLICS
jgi:protein-disulfide isomerase-like protein with CxxC motif